MKRRILAFLLFSFLVLASCVPASSEGIVRGVVYGDLNSDGMIDDSEQMSRVTGVEVILSDCGLTQTQLTDGEGSFNFEHLPEGTCHVSVSKSGWIYDGSFPDLGVYPIPVASDSSLPTSFSIYMAPEGGIPIAEATYTPTPAISPTPSYTPTSAQPMVTPSGVDVNCRYGPGTEFLSTGSLRVGEIVPIRGTITARSWWQIEDPRNLGTFCWVKASLTSTTGDLSLVPLAAVPTGLVIDLTISTPPVVHGTCGGPNPTSFSVSITTNGPTVVTYHIEIFNGDGTLRNSTSASTLTFAAFGTQTFDPGGVYKTDCGSFYVKVIVTAPNNMSARADWSVVSP